MSCSVMNVFIFQMSWKKKCTLHSWRQNTLNEVRANYNCQFTFSLPTAYFCLLLFTAVCFCLLSHFFDAFISVCLIIFYVIECQYKLCSLYHLESILQNRFKYRSILYSSSSVSLNCVLFSCVCSIIFALIAKGLFKPYCVSCEISIHRWNHTLADTVSYQAEPWQMLWEQHLKSCSLFNGTFASENERSCIEKSPQRLWPMHDKLA